MSVPVPLPARLLLPATQAATARSSSLTSDVMVTSSSGLPEENRLGSSSRPLGDTW